MSEQVLVSVVMASHNRGLYLSQAVESIEKQTYIHWELWIGDDASTDDSWELIQAWAKKDCRIKIFRNKENRGVGFTKKKLMDMAQGEIICVVDADDGIEADALEKVLSVHNKYPNVALVYTDHYICDEKLNPINKPSISRAIPQGESHLSYHAIGHLVTVKKKFYKNIKLNSHLKIAVDQDFYYQMEEQGDVVFIPEKLYLYRQNPQSISLNQHQFEAAEQKVKLMKEARQRRINQSLNLPLPSVLYLDILEWYAREKLGRGNVLKAIPRALSQGKLRIIFGILYYHIKRRW